MPTARVLLYFLPLWVFIPVYKTGAALHYTLFPALAERVFPVAVVGIIVAAASVAQLLLDIPAGSFVDRAGARRGLAFTVGCFLLAAATLAFGLSPTTILLTAFFGVFGWLFQDPAVVAYLLTCLPAGYAGRGMALRNALESLGVVLATAAFTFVLGFRPSLIAAALVVVFLASAITLSFLPRGCPVGMAPPPPLTPRDPRPFFPKLASAIERLNPAATLLFLSGFAAAAFYGTIWLVVPILIGRSADHGIPGVGLAVFDLTVVLLGFLFGRIADRWEHRTLVLLGLLAFAVAGTVLGFSAGLWFIVLGFLATSGDEIANVSLWAWLHRLDRDHTTDGLIAGAVAMARDLGWAVGPLAAGFLFTAVGPSWTITIGALPIFAVWVGAIVLFGWRRAEVYVRSELPIPPLPRRRLHGR